MYSKKIRTSAFVLWYRGFFKDENKREIVVLFIIETTEMANKKVIKKVRGKCLLRLQNHISTTMPDWASNVPRCSSITYDYFYNFYKASAVRTSHWYWNCINNIFNCTTLYCAMLKFILVYTTLNHRLRKTNRWNLRKAYQYMLNSNMHEI